MIKMEYEKRQNESYKNFLNSRLALYSKIPEIEEIDFKIKKTGVNLNRFIVMGLTERKAELIDQLNELKKRKNLILQSINYPVESLKRKYKCTKCSDTGYVNIGNYSKKCSCYEQLVISILYKESNLNLTEVQNFAKFDESLYTDSLISCDVEKGCNKFSPRDNILVIKENIMKFIENFQSPQEKNLFLTGPTGVGKTFICSCIAYELLNKSHTVLYQSAPALFDTLNDYKFKNNKDFNNKNNKFNEYIYNNIFNVELLIIDDLGTEFKSNSRYADLLNVLNSRSFANAKNKIRKTVISTNLNTKQLYEYYDERTASRIIGDYNIYRFIGEDIRKIKRFRNSVKAM